MAGCEKPQRQRLSLSTNDEAGYELGLWKAEGQQYGISAWYWRFSDFCFHEDREYCGTTGTRVTDWTVDKFTSWHGVQSAAFGGESASAIRRYVLLGGVSLEGRVAGDGMYVSGIQEYQHITYFVTTSRAKSSRLSK